MTALSSCCLT